jgi:hypothetical protein
LSCTTISLCISHSIARSIGQANILPAIFECARPDTCPVELNIEAAQLLLVLSEDSAAFAAQVKGNAMCVQVYSSRQPQAAHPPQL